MAKSNNMRLGKTEIELLQKGIESFSLFEEYTGINPLDNYAYREILQIVELENILPSIQKVPGRTGADAKAVGEGYTNIELKSSGYEKDPSIDKWPGAVFDMSKMKSYKTLYNWEGFGHSLFCKGTTTPSASYWISKEHIKKLHPLFDKQINNFKKIKESKSSMREAVYLKLSEVLKYINEEDIVFFKEGKQVNEIRR